MNCKCGYNLTGNKSGFCPECGTQIHHREDWNTLTRMPKPRIKTRSLLLIMGMISVCFVVGIGALIMRANRSSARSVLIAVSQLKSLQYALEMYHNDYASFPSESAGLSALRAAS